MAEIIWKGLVDSEKEFPVIALPANAARINGADSMGEMMKKAWPFMMPPAVICAACMFLKTHINGNPVIDPLFIPLGLLFGFMGLLPHELLHAAAYPKGAAVEIGWMKNSFSAFAVSTFPLTKKRFVFMSGLPLLLGIVPLFLFVVSPPHSKELNAVIWGLAFMGMFSPYPDFYNIYNVMRQVPKGALTQTSGFHSYWYTLDTRT